jgi:hypothetical protein
MERTIRRHSSARAACVTLALLAVVALAHAVPTNAQQPIHLEDFTQAAPQGFGDFHNSMARASEWWNGRLYVATSRDHACVQQATLGLYNPFKPYPPPDPTLICTPDPRDLPLQAEIWRWTPDSGDPAADGVWEMVYQSPLIPIPGTDKMTAREVGFRDSAIFTEADGTEALYFTGITTRILFPELPPPTLLRSTDGVNFAPVPQDPGTTLGDVSFEEGITITSFNRIAAFGDRLFLVVGGDFGHGVIYEATHPQSGNNAFTRVSPPGMTVTYMLPFQGSMYVAQGAQPVGSNPPYKVLKMDTSTWPYTFTTVVDGTRLPFWNTGSSPKSVATMHVAGGHLWIGTNQPAELIRINPNDTWDLVIGDSRQTTSGEWKYPQTGLGDSFDWFFNIHVHRIQDHDGFLYVLSNDVSNGYPLNTIDTFNELFRDRYGFDVHRTRNGWHFYPITVRGFEELDPGGGNNWYNFTGRVANSTPYGLFLGTGNNQFGTQIWRARPGAPVLPPPAMLEVERTGAGTVLSWDPSPGAAFYRIFKADYAYWWQLGVPFYAGGSTYPRPFTEIATTTETSYIDPTPLGLWSHYYVVANNGSGGESNGSNAVRAPSLGRSATFGVILNTLTEWHGNNELSSDAQTQIRTQLQQARFDALLGNYPQALAVLAQLKQTAAFAPPPLLAPWRVQDLQVLLGKLIRRVELGQQGTLPAWMVVL